jgi:hypothetical protein
MRDNYPIWKRAMKNALHVKKKMVLLMVLLTDQNKLKNNMHFG